MNYWSSKLGEWSRSRPHAPAIVQSDTSITWLELDHLTKAFCDVLQQSGVRPDSRAVIALPRSIGAVVSIASCLRIGVSGLVIDRNGFRQQLASTLLLGLHDIVIFSDQDTDVVRPVLKVAISSEKYREVRLPLGMIGLISVARNSTPIPPDTGWFLQTSGSTRAPLTAVLDRVDLINRAEGEARDFKIDNRSSLLNILSLSHDLGFNQTLCSLTVGATLTIHTDPFSSRLLALLDSHTFDGVVGTPVVWTELLKRNPSPIRGLRFLTISGGPLASAFLRRLSTTFPESTQIKTYGQTETFRSLLGINQVDDSLGAPIDGVKVRIISPDCNDCDCGSSESSFTMDEAVCWAIGATRRAQVEKKLMAAFEPVISFGAMKLVGIFFADAWTI